MTETGSLVGVVGGGVMGAGITYALLSAGSDVVLVDVGQRALDAAAVRIGRYLARGSEAHPPKTGGARAVGRLTVATTMESLRGSGLVIEAVPESVELKRRVLAGIEAHVEGALLATNTSSISIDELAIDLSHAELFAGLHFFNPVPASDLVEIVRGAHTSDATISRLESAVVMLGKQSVVVRDSPGFASSRLGVAIALEAMRMVEEGVASADDIDQAMTLGYRHRTGPLATSDLVGLDVRLRIADYLASTLGARFAPPDILRRLVSQGHLGRKTGRGFHEWKEA